MANGWWPLTPDVAYWAIWPLPGLIWTLFTVINELMLISRLEMTRHSVGGCLSRLSRDHLILISDRDSGISSSDAAGSAQYQASGPSPAPGTCSALAYVSLHSLTSDSCLSNVSSPLRLKYQFRKPIWWHYHSPDVVLFVVALLLSSLHLLLRAVSELFYVSARSRVSCWFSWTLKTN